MAEPACRLQLGLPANLRSAAAALYWQAFGAKLGRVMGPTPKALAYLERVIRADHAIVALDESGNLLGLVGFQTPEGSFAAGEFADLAEVYGLSGALWRTPMLKLLVREIDNDRFLLDGICVAAEARGQGIGSRLIEAISAEARARGYRDLRLDVVDTNARAKDLYLRLGFVAFKTDHLGVLQYVFGFRAAISMVKAL